jgi:hypothetical protein
VATSSEDENASPLWHIPIGKITRSFRTDAEWATILGLNNSAQFSCTVEQRSI